MNSQLTTDSLQLKTLILCSVLCLLTSVVGCQKPQKQDAAQQQAKGTKRGVPIVVTDGSAFPAELLAGIWQQEGEIRREFIVSPDGLIVSAVLGMGLTRVSPVEETRVPLRDGTEGFFVPGNWSATFDPVERQLSVSVEMNSFRLQNGPEIVEGVIRESFIGIINEDGKKWTVNYYGIPIIHAFTSDGKEHVLKDGGDPDEETFVFERVYNPFENKTNP